MLGKLGDVRFGIKFISWLSQGVSFGITYLNKLGDLGELSFEKIGNWKF